jgi:eukaryotic-like serine/threonine-protein kinase
LGNLPLQGQERVLLQPGTLIAGRYEIHSPLASGGNGLVYSATDRTTEKRVAIKILGPHMLNERAAREKMRLEAIVAGRVESEHIVQVSDAGVDTATGIPFLVMELLKGQDLQHHVEQRGPLETALALEYLRQVASGLDKAHGWRDHDGQAAPIVHRDLKPENLFLTHREDGGPLVKILDFGLAKVLSVSATLSTEVRGTPLYMAPEQLSQTPVTPATDIWALGLIAFFFLTAKSYWLTGQDDRTTLPAVLKEVADGAHCPARARLCDLGSSIDLPEAFDEWFSRCVNQNPSLRFQFAGEAIKALGVALDRPSVSSPFAAAGISRVSTSVPTAAAASHPDSRLDQPSAPSSISANVATDDTAHPKRAPLIRIVVAALVVLVAAIVVLSMRRERPDAPPIADSPAATQAPAQSAPEPVPEAPASASADLPSANLAPRASTVPDRPEAKAPPEAKSPRAQTTVSGATAPPRAAPVTNVSSVRNSPGSSRSASDAVARASASSGATAAAAPSSRDGSLAPIPSAPRAPRDPADHR